MPDESAPAVNEKPMRRNVASRFQTRTQQRELEERRETLRVLLSNPLVPAAGDTAAAFRLVRRHTPWLRDWLKRWPGWTLVVSNDVARLRKTPSLRADATRGLEEKGGSERSLFSRRSYALLCLVLSTLENEQGQTTLQQAARKTEVTVRLDEDLAEAGFQFEPKTLAHRRELVTVMRRLEAWHVLVRIDRDDHDFVQGDGDCLYRVDRAGLATVLCSVRGASTVQAASVDEFIDKLNEVETPESPESQNRELQHQLVRRLLDDPVMYFDELTAQEYDYFTAQGERLLKELSRETGLIVERRAEGVALLDSTGGWTDVGLPEQGTRGHSTLLLAEWLAEQHRETSQVECRVSMDDAIEKLSELAEQHREHWRQGSATPDGVRRLATEAIDLLCSLALVELSGQHIIPRPAIARYRVADLA